MVLDSFGTRVGYRSAVLPLSPLSVAGPLHGGLGPTPVPHWAVLLGVVPALWLVIGGAVLAVDRLLDRLDG